ncbi:DUF805 domain-containing protein [Roseomonas eburnea]|uniref:DUF805 domain-containing protein n=1 Tax=Neoroseomonas eburnea TaxID=1346889 RepID=A0A9X9X756_9PROT|nr:DUF805 domain-containing protein [Neoroseomonas eburnea]MBR0679542.1 DUF805 domain-containing protein [Neoroseomonas eburnea]
MTFGQWFSFRGRIGRKVFWLGYVLPLFLASLVAAVLDAAIGLAPTGDAMPVDAATMGPFSAVVSLLSIWPSLAGTIKRLHDRDRSGWWIGAFYLLAIVVGAVAGVMAATMPYSPEAMAVPLIVGGLLVLGFALWLLVETGFLRGTAGPNRFGPDPLGGQGMAQWQQQPAPGWQQQPQQWQQPQWTPPQGQGGYPPQGWQPPPQQGYPPPQQGYPPPQQGYGAPPPGYGQPPPGYGQPPQPPPGQWGGPGQGGSVPPVRRD